jgi:hypothetical protein
MKLDERRRGRDGRLGAEASRRRLISVIAPCYPPRASWARLGRERTWLAAWLTSRAGGSFRQLVGSKVARTRLCSLQRCDAYRPLATLRCAVCRACCSFRARSRRVGVVRSMPWWTAWSSMSVASQSVVLLLYIQFTLCKIGSCIGMHFVYRTGGANTSVPLGRSVHCVLRIVYFGFCTVGTFA